ncbi:Nif3-like dinuclear metal center hexameric protein [Paracidobacterium acidisoli]|uniref:NGG1p interacting factor NIF3 n=1 Tax=Paracidobacterium acidisoli TaxID=2303751 RepID=A0A372IV00_9BACT|nr:Nif3-like dinuclear metal center hexameric protein [Paracidobacterium acidisoli]MBT9330095.1 Nif3-like dinuclear metal center hexameric protein [Paracidobacterium acidisoli]
MSPLSRREFVVAGSAFLSQLAVAQTPQPKLTAGEVVKRIQKQVGIPWRATTVDVIVAGDENTPVNGIASVMMATQDVIERAAAEGKNMIVSHETPFYLQQDKTDDIQGNPVLQYKLDFIRKHNMAIFRFHDHWHARHPDGIAAGMAHELGWDKNVDDPSNPRRLTFPGTPLAKFAQEMQTRLHARTMRVVGDPGMPVHHVQASWGYLGREPGIAMISRPDVDVLICGETREWELVEFARDCVTEGQKKALIVVGHVLSEQGGMILCADWLRSFIPEVPVAYIPTPEPFWNPQHPVKG